MYMYIYNIYIYIICIYIYMYIGVASKFFGAPQAPIARGAGEEECDMRDRRGNTLSALEALEGQDHEPAGTKSTGLWTSLRVY
jgi:hypothetical protein